MATIGNIQTGLTAQQITNAVMSVRSGQATAPSSTSSAGTVGSIQTGATAAQVTNAILSARASSGGTTSAAPAVASPVPGTIGAMQTGLTAQGVRDAVLGVRNQGFSVDVPSNIPSTALHGNMSPQDVLAMRNQMELQSRQPTFESFLSSLNNPQDTFSTNKMLAMALFPQQTALQQEASELRGLAAEAGGRVKDVLADRKDTRQMLNDLERDVGLPELRQRLQASSERVAQLQGDMIRAEQQIMDEPGQTKIGAEARLDPVRRQMTAEILAEALIQQALVGNVAAAQQNVDRILQLEFAEEERRINSAMMEMQLIEREIQRMEPELQQEAQNRMLQFQVAMTIRSEQLQDERFNRQATLNVMTQALQSGADDSTARAIFNASTPEEALALAGSTLGNPFRLQQEAQQFSQWIQREQMNIARMQLSASQAAAEADALRKMDEMTLKVGADYARDERVQQYQIAETAYSRVNAIAPNRTQDTIKDIASNSTAVDALSRQYARLVDPIAARAADTGDITATKKIDEQARNIVNDILKDAGTAPRKVGEVLTAIDKLYVSAKNIRDSANRDFESRLVSGVPLPNMDVSAPVNQSITTGLDSDRAWQVYQRAYMQGLF